MKKLAVVLFSLLVLTFAGTDMCSGQRARLVSQCSVPIGNYAVYYLRVLSTCPDPPKALMAKRYMIVPINSPLAKCGKHKIKRVRIAEHDCSLTAESAITSSREGFKGTITLEELPTIS